jgi:hypothetical protein
MLVAAKTTFSGKRTRLLVVAMTILLAITVLVCAQEMKVPETATDHHQMAEHYQKVETQTREDVEMHTKMLSEFIKTVAKNPKAGENPYAKKMRLHCEKYIKAAQALATEAAESAKFHDLRAKELEGK